MTYTTYPDSALAKSLMKIVEAINTALQTNPKKEFVSKLEFIRDSLLFAHEHILPGYGGGAEPASIKKVLSIINMLKAFRKGRDWKAILANEDSMKAYFNFPDDLIQPILRALHSEITAFAKLESVLDFLHTSVLARESNRFSEEVTREKTEKWYFKLLFTDLMQNLQGLIQGNETMKIELQLTDDSFKYWLIATNANGKNTYQNEIDLREIYKTKRAAILELMNTKLGLDGVPTAALALDASGTKTNEEDSEMGILLELGSSDFDADGTELPTKEDIAAYQAEILDNDAVNIIYLHQIELIHEIKEHAGPAIPYRAGPSFVATKKENISPMTEEELKQVKELIELHEAKAEAIKNEKIALLTTAPLLQELLELLKPEKALAAKEELQEKKEQLDNNIATLKADTAVYKNISLKLLTAAETISKALVQKLKLQDGVELDNQQKGDENDEPAPPIPGSDASVVTGEAGTPSNEGKSFMSILTKVNVPSIKSDLLLYSAQLNARRKSKKHLERKNLVESLLAELPDGATDFNKDAINELIQDFATKFPGLNLRPILTRLHFVLNPGDLEMVEEDQKDELFIPNVQQLLEQDPKSAKKLLRYNNALATVYDQLEVLTNMLSRKNNPVGTDKEAALELANSLKHALNAYINKVTRPTKEEAQVFVQKFTLKLKSLDDKLAQYRAFWMPLLLNILAALLLIPLVAKAAYSYKKDGTISLFGQKSKVENQLEAIADTLQKVANSHPGEITISLMP